MDEKLLEERYKLCKLKITRIEAKKPIRIYGEYFKSVSGFLLMIFRLKEKGDLKQDFYKDIREDAYLRSYANPDVCADRFGKKIGRLLSFIYAECLTLPPYMAEGELEEVLIRMEFFIEIFCLCECYVNLSEAEYDENELCRGLYKACYSFFYDYLDYEMENRVAEKVDPKKDHALKIVMGSDLSTSDYLYLYAENITENEIRTYELLRSLPEDMIDRMADTYTEGYRVGFYKTGKDISKKKVVNIVYPIGFERVVRKAVENFEKIGLKCTLTKNSTSVFHKRGIEPNGYYATPVNRQFLFDHREDEALFLDKRYVKRKLSALEKAYGKYEELSKVHGGPAWIEIFGRKDFLPVKKKSASAYTKRQEALVMEYTYGASKIINQYIPGDERSFTIIAYPIPDIGEDYEDIMKETIALNSLSSETYDKIQKCITDALDECEYVKVLGMNGNKTDIRVNLCKLKSPGKETKFENCTADVNIPVGEVFTSPVLKDTTGILNVKKVFLNGLLFKDLTIEFKDGMTTEYDCSNYVNQSENKAYIKENILKRHESLPIGEFAIGTNTLAYAMGRRYEIEDKLPILIAEKTGPHFAVGDTCYSRSEDIRVYNSDGKEIVAKDNEISILRLDPERAGEAYLNCHTDITLPYDELGRLYGVKKDGTEVDIIKEGRFVLQGTEDLNRPL